MSMEHRLHRRPRRARIAPCWLPVLGAVAIACGGRSDGRPGSSDDPDRLVVSTRMSASEGGELTLDDGAIVAVPPGALDGNGEVTFTRRTCGGVFGSSYFASCLFEVNSTAPLVQPFFIGLPQRDEASGAGVCTARQSAPGWPCLAERDTTSGGPLATSSAFSLFATRATVSPADDMRVIDVPFVPCGGALEGSWDLVGATGTADQVDPVIRIRGTPDPRAACGVGEHLEDKPFTLTGRLVFAPAGQDAKDGRGSAKVSEGLDVRRYTITTQACLDRVGESCDNADFGNEHEGRCAWHENLCECDVADSGGAFIGGMTWSYAGAGRVNLENEQRRYCVEGDRLSLEVTDLESGAPFLKLYQRSTL